MILVSSIAGLQGLVGVAHYTAAKHGVVGLMRSLANELATHRVRVNTVHPTNVDTPLIQNDAVRSAFRPDLDRPPTREEFAESESLGWLVSFVIRPDPTRLAPSPPFDSESARFAALVERVRSRLRPA